MNTVTIGLEEYFQLRKFRDQDYVWLSVVYYPIRYY